MKKIGITLIETVISMMILTIVITVLASSVRGYKLNLKTRLVKEELSRVIYCVMQELKYNYSIDEIKEASVYGPIYIKNYYGILYDLKNNDLLNLESGEGISIVILEENPNNIKIKLEVEAFSYGIDFSSKKEFVKWR